MVEMRKTEIVYLDCDGTWVDLYGVEKSTISNIKRKKSWTHLTKCYNFTIKKQKNKQESL